MDGFLRVPFSTHSMALRNGNVLVTAEHCSTDAMDTDKVLDGDKLQEGSEINAVETLSRSHRTVSHVSRSKGRAGPRPLITHAWSGSTAVALLSITPKKVM